MTLLPVLSAEERDGFEKLFSAYYDCRQRRALCRTALARLEAQVTRAEQKLSAIRAHVVDAPHYVSADQLRQHLLEMLDADAPVFPSLMSHVKEER
jgi:hypothetical protein